ncbi:LacI family DNA-binding transcriptional regulator [Microbacterium sp. NPDC055903]
MKRVGIRAVAAEAGVSSGTVSHYLNHPELVSPERAKRVEEAIERLGFVRNDVARQLKMGRSFSLGYIAPESGNPYSIGIAEALEGAAEAHGYSLFVANTRDDPDRERAYLDLFAQYGFGGLVVSSAGPVEQRLALLRERGMPSVLLRRTDAAEQPSIAADDIRGGELAAQELISTGCTRLAFVGGPTSVRQVADRLHGATGVVSQTTGARIELIDTPVRTIAAGVAAGERIVAMAPSERPNGIFAANDLLAIGVEQALVTAGIAIPEEIAIIGYDDIEYAANSLVPLSSIEVPRQAMGEAAIAMLMAQIDAVPLSESHAVFAPRLIRRRSTTR